MNWLDIGIVVILSINVIFSLKRGLIREVFGLAGIILGLLVASKFYKDILIFENIFKSPMLTRIISFILIFLGVGLLFSLIGTLVHKLVKIGGLGMLNYLGGFIFGFLKGVIIIGIILFVMAKIPFISKLIEKSPIASAILRLFKNIIYFIWTRPETTEYI